MLPTSAQQAIKAALNSHWEDAIAYNLATLEDNPSDTDALNRLATAYLKLNQPKLAEATYQKVLRLDHYNLIAKKNLDKIAAFKSVPTHPSPSPILATAPTFLEEPGKTKIVKLIKIADTNIIHSLTPGQLVKLASKAHTIAVTTLHQTYIGSLPDDLAHRLLKFIKAGNKYQTVIRTAQPANLQIFIRETYRSKRFLATPSFSLNRPSEPPHSPTRLA